MPLPPMKPSSAMPLESVKNSVPKVKVVVREVVAIPGHVAPQVWTRASCVPTPAMRFSSS